MRRIAALMLIATVPVAHAMTDEDMRNENRQRMAAIHADIETAARAESAGFVNGSLRVYVFGPGATVALYEIAAGDGTRQQHMVVLESRSDTDAGEAAPPLQGAHVTLHFYARKQVAMAHAKIGADGWRKLDLAHASVREERSDKFELLATVSLPVISGGDAVVFRFSHGFEDAPAEIAETAD